MKFLVLFVILFRFFKMFLDFFYILIFSGRFDTSVSMIALSVSEISALDSFCDEQEQEWGILVVG